MTASLMQLPVEGRERKTILAKIAGESLAVDTPVDEQLSIDTCQTQGQPSGWETPGEVVSIMGIDNYE